MPVSIIIPAFNEEKYIEETLKALPSEHEIIVVCNGCTDNTASVAKRYTDKVIITEDKGVSMARNLGALKATHEKLIFLDADITINKKIIETIEKTRYKLGSVKLKPYQKNWKAYFLLYLKNLIARFYRSGGVIFCTKTIFQKVKGFREDLKFREDVIFLEQTKKYTKYKFINKPAIVNMRRYEKLGYFKESMNWFTKIVKNQKEKHKPIR